MSEIDKNYVGKVVRMEYTHYDKPQNVVGYVFDQKSVATAAGLCTEFSVCLTNGREWNPRFFPKSDLRISSVRMDKDLRAALKAYGDARTAQIAFQKRFEEMKKQHHSAVENARGAVQAVSPDMSITDMMTAVEDLFKEKFPSSGSYYQRYFSCTTGGEKSVVMTQYQDVDKYANPEKYSFLYREYDNTIHVRCESKAFRDFCEKNAPAVIPALKGYKSSVEGSLGDKEWLSACRCYEIPLKHGLTKQSLEEIRNTLEGRNMKASLADQIRTAGSKKSDANNKTKKTERDR